MNRGYFLALAPALLAVEHYVAQTPAPEATFSPNLAQSDLDGIWSAVLDVGAEPFFTSNRATVEALYKKQRASITKPVTIRQAWLAMAPVLGALNDGHVGILFPDPLNQAPFRFPLHFALSDANDVIVIRDHTNTIAIGSRLISVNGVSATMFRDTTLVAFGAQTQLLHRSRVTTAGAWTAIALFGDTPIYHVVWNTPDGKQHADDLLATPPTRSTAPSVVQPYTYRMLQNGTIGYIDYRSCEDLDRFKKFLADTFQTIEMNPIRALVIDIRRNGGGDSDLNDQLWQYVTTKPFRQFGAIIEKSCTRLKAEYGPTKYKMIYGEEAWDAPDGKIIEFDNSPDAGLIHPGPLPLRYHGPVYLLISAQTFSSAMSCALAAKDYGLATIVGEETGEPVNGTGEVYGYSTPGLGLRAYMTTKVYLAPKPHPNDQGVVPDIAVTTTPADIAAERDPVLNRVLSLVASA
jgi:hypothetical protein